MSNEENKKEDYQEEKAEDLSSIVKILLKYPNSLTKIENLTKQIEDFINEN